VLKQALKAGTYKLPIKMSIHAIQEAT